MSGIYAFNGVSLVSFAYSKFTNVFLNSCHIFFTYFTVFILFERFYIYGINYRATNAVKNVNKTINDN